MSVFNLKEAFLEVLKFFHLKALSDNYNLVIKFESKMPLMCYADKTRLQQLLANVTSNAVKNSANKDIMIKVEFNNQD